MVGVEKLAGHGVGSADFITDPGALDIAGQAGQKRFLNGVAISHAQPGAGVRQAVGLTAFFEQGEQAVGASFDGGGVDGHVVGLLQK